LFIQSKSEFNSSAFSSELPDFGGSAFTLVKNSDPETDSEIRSSDDIFQIGLVETVGELVPLQCVVVDNYWFVNEVDEVLTKNTLAIFVNI